MKIFIINTLRKMFCFFGFVLKKESEIQKIKLHHGNALKLLMKESVGNENDNEISSVVFSKDRPMQLYGLIKSFYKNVQSPCGLMILYSASDSRFKVAYEEVRELCVNMDVKFYEETSFKDDLVHILENANTKKIFFLVDDILFIRKINFTDFLSVDLSRVVPSLRLGLNLQRCYTANSKQLKPAFSGSDDEGYSWSWSEGEYDWGYPLSVDGNFFLLEEIIVMVKISEFNAPNSFEKSLQWFLSEFIKRRGLCYKESVVVNIPFNKVQNENGNISGKVSEFELLDYWEQGYELDVGKYNQINNISAHQELNLFMTKRVA